MTAGRPMFRRIKASDLGLIRRMTEAFPPYSEMQPTAMLAWDTNQDGELAIINGNLAFKLPHYDGAGYFVTFLGTHQVVKTVRQLLSFARSQSDVEPRLRRIPEVVIRHAAGLQTRFAVTPAPEDFDYVFAIADPAALTGADYEEKRRAIRRLQAQTATEIRPFDVRDGKAQALMIDLFDRWAAAKDVEHLPESVMERQAPVRLFSVAETTGDAVIGLALLDEADVPLGFCTAAVLDHGYAIGHFEKTDPGRPGVSALMRQRIAQHLQARGCRYLNGEPDQGEQVMRVSKLSWAPRFFLRKYTIAET